MRARAQIQIKPYLARLPTCCEPVQSSQPTHVRPEGWWVVKFKMGEQECDLSRMREPLHVKFPNWGRTAEEIGAFTGRYGLITDVSHRGSQGKFYVEAWLAQQDRFRRLWEEARRADPEKVAQWMADFLELYEPVNQPLWESDFEDLRLSPGRTAEEIFGWPKLSIRLRYSRKGLVIKLVPRGTWAYLVLCLLMEKPTSLRMCENDACPARYFVARRKDQKFCGSDCARLVTNRRWWRKKGKQWRRKRKRKTRR